MITYSESIANPGVHNVQPVIEIAGLNLTLKAGVFRVSGHDYGILDDQTFAVPNNPTNGQYLKGWITLDKNAGNAILLCDLVVQDGVDTSYVSGSDQYELLWRAFKLSIPAATSDLATLDLEIYRTITSPEEVE